MRKRVNGLDSEFSKNAKQWVRDASGSWCVQKLYGWRDGENSILVFTAILWIIFTYRWMKIVASLFPPFTYFSCFSFKSCTANWRRAKLCVVACCLLALQATPVTTPIRTHLCIKTSERSTFVVDSRALLMIRLYQIEEKTGTIKWSELWVKQHHS